MNELYFESGYLEASYFGTLGVASSSVSVSAGVSAQGDIASVTGYYIPDYIEVDYFFAFVSASAAITSSFASVSVVNKTTSANAEFTAAFTQTATISHIEGADLFAFSNAAIAVQVSRIRDNNIAASAVFGIAVDVVRIKSSSGDDFAEFSFTANTVLARSRDYASSQSAAFSLAVDAVKTAKASSSQSSQFTQTAVAVKAVVATANLESFASILVSRQIAELRPRNLPVTVSGSTYYDATNKKFGTHSLHGSGTLNFDKRLTTGANLPNNITIANGESFVLEAYVRLGSNNSSILTVRIAGIQIGIQTNGVKGFAGIIDSTGNFVFLTESFNAISSYNVFNHLLVVSNGTTASWYFNGNRRFTTSSLPSAYFTSGVLLSGQVDYWIDEFSFHKGTTLGYDPASSTITVPTAARTNSNPTTQALWHFDNNALDDFTATPLTFTGDAGLTSISSVTAAVGFITNGQADLSALSSITAIIGTLETTNLVAFSDAAVTTNADRLRGHNAECLLASSVSATAFRIKQIASDITASSSINIQAIKTAVGSSNNSIAVTQTSQAVKTVSTGSSLSLESTFTGTISHIEGADLVALSDAALTVAFARIREFNSAQASQFTQIANANKTVDVTSSQISESAQTADVSRTRNASANFALSVSTETQGTKFKGSAVALTSAFDTINRYLDDDYIESGYYEQFEIIAQKTARGTAAIQSVATLTVGITASVFAVLTTQSSSSVTATINKTVGVQIANASVFAQTATASRIRSTASTFTANTTVTANGLKGGEIALVAFTNASVNILTSINKPASAGLNTTATFIVNTQDSLSITAGSNLNVVSTFTASARKIAGAQAQIQAAGFVVSVSVAQKIFLAQFATVSTFTAVAVKTTTIQSNITGVSNVNAIVGIRKPFTAAITSALTFVVVVRELRLDAIVYVIPAEGWTYRIEGETRLHTILGESRVKEIVGETRLDTINGESRIHII